MSTLGRFPSTSGAASQHSFAKLLVGVLAGGLIILSAVAIGIWAGSRSEDGVPSPSPQVSSSTAEKPVQHGANAQTFYIVSDPELASLLQAAIDQTNVHRRLEGSPFVAGRVVVAPTEAEADKLKAAFIYGNRILVGLGLPEDTVVDLRGQ